MAVVLKYNENPSFAIHKIEVIADFNGKIIVQGFMEKQENTWTFTCNLKSGEYKYKFIINDTVRLNDPSANVYIPDENEELWSYLKVNEDGDRLYSTEEYSVSVEEYAIHSVVTENVFTTNKKLFNLYIDKKVVARFKIDVVTGIHTATLVWMNPRGEIYNWAEEKLFQLESMKDQPFVLWFWLDLNNDILEGKWTLKLFIDGEYILEDNFNIMRMLTYSQNYIR